MLKNGLVEEVERLREMGLHAESMVSMQGLGYKEILDWLDGEISLTRKPCEILKRDTRHFAKRQLTWFQTGTGCDLGRQGRLLITMKRRSWHFMLRDAEREKILPEL